MAYLKFYFALLFLWGEEIIGFFRSLLMLIPVLLLTYWRFQEVLVLGVKFLFHLGMFLFHVGMFIIFDSAPESIKKSISRSGG